MTQFKFFTVLAALVGSMWAIHAQASANNVRFERSAAEDSLKKPKPNPAFLTDDELALLVEHIPYEPDEVIQDRLNCIEADIPLVFNKFVRNHIDYFTVRNRKYTRTMISRENVYFPIYEKYLKKYNMPQDIKYLSIVESGLNPKAASWAGAVGPWQFIKTTGKEYGLNQDQHIDERMDVEKSTDAAMRFLSRLYRIYGDWELAMAAYNCGPGNVNKAIRKAGGGQKGFWEIFPYLPKETRSYVPSMTAVIYAMKYAPEHNIFSDSILYAADYTHLEVNQAIDLNKLAAELHVDTLALLALNPEIKKASLPETTRKYKLRVPAQAAKLLALDQSCILLAAAPTPLPAKQQLITESPILLASAENSRKDSLEQKTYIVRPGDNLTQIARVHGVTVAELKEWNQLEGATIMAQQKLLVWQPAKEAAPVMLASAKALANDKAKPAASKTPTSKALRERIYHVQPGDTLWTISQRHDGVTVEQIKKLNKLKDSAIKPGQQLILG
ncbi:LysM peptidoglycan-binding domain-containing protein [Pontibacter sp. JH31]|uniref:LysM peptidoglycan-binding domain-containing protein n=1 Tax=Pontibacter aquaedesilientis TaxID=2766980 RepID=A0ABR7XG06_9BACT|nr:lytic transglycosylase domain-containing protein [Pontibacter aquaedesilientis]MBD1396538.1 LysM peptidoglycan-binding domain-containing protein [Pontibacter aquaedesilientis]